MKRLFVSIVMTALLVLPTLAQEPKRPRFNPEEFKAKMEAFIAQKAGLTVAESEKVFPIFHEMKQKQRELMKKEAKMRRTCVSDVNEKQCADLVMKIIDIHEDNVDIEEAYYKKMCKVISAKKVFAIMQADNAFHREVLQRANKNEHKPKPKP